MYTQKYKNMKIFEVFFYRGKIRAKFTIFCTKVYRNFFLAHIAKPNLAKMAHRKEQRLRCVNERFAIFCLFGPQIFPFSRK
jgi:hypothetical protein